MGVHWKDWCWSWHSNTLATWCKELTHLKRLWCWERAGEGDDRGGDGWMASLTQWTWVWVNSGSWWWTGRPGVLWLMGSQRVGNNWVTEIHWTELKASIGFHDLSLIRLKASRNDFYMLFQSVVPRGLTHNREQVGKNKTKQKSWSHTVEFCCCSVAKSCPTNSLCLLGLQGDPTSPS